MFLRLKALYDAGRIGAAQLDAAVERGWLTADQAADIIGA